MPRTAGTRGAAGRSAHMESPRPFTDPLTVGLAGVTLLALAAGSFTNALAHKLNLPSAVEGAEVVVLPPSDAPPPLPVPALANLETAAPAPKPKAEPQPAPAAEPEPRPATPQIVPLVPPAADAHEIAEDAAATGATHSEQPEPTAPPPEEAPAY